MSNQPREIDLLSKPRWGVSRRNLSIAAALLVIVGTCFTSFGKAQSLLSGSNIAGIDPAPPGSPVLLAGEPGVTAIAGRVLSVDGRPLQGVRVTDDVVGTITDEHGRFLLAGVAPGETVVVLDGRHALAALSGQSDYGYYEMRVAVKAGATTALPFVDWLTPIDHDHEVQITAPLAKPVTVTTPSIPNLELRIPAGAIITDPDHKVVTHVGLTKISTRKPPFPLPSGFHVPVYFTAQPGGSVISSTDGTWLGAQVVYPNYHHQLPRAQELFWRYDPDNSGWSSYGTGTVTNDGRQVVPDERTRIYAFNGAMIGGGPAPCKLVFICGLSKGPKGGDPVDLWSGSFRFSHTDMNVSDVIPISLERFYNSADTTAASFGAGMASAYDMQPMSLDNFATAILTLPNGSIINFSCTFPTTGCAGSLAVGQTYTSSTPGEFYQAVLAWHASVFPFWTVSKTDGTVFFFPWAGGPQGVSRIQDRFGNAVTITRDIWNKILQVTSTNGRSISFSYTNNVVTQATDNGGRTFIYGYDSNYQMLQTVTDPDGGVTTYTWNNGQIVSVSDPRKNTFITNQYDTNLRVHQQTLADGASTYIFNYTLGAFSQTAGSLTEKNVVATQVTDPNKNVRNLTWDRNGYVNLTWDRNGHVLTDHQAQGVSGVEIDTTYCRSGDVNAATCPAISGVPAGYVADLIDGLGRDTHYTYDQNANVTSITYLYGASNALPCAAAGCTYSYTYSPTFNQLTSLTDPLLHTTIIQRGVYDEVVSIIDPLSDTYSFTYTPQGQVQTITDAVMPANTTTLNYLVGDLTSIVDPLSRTTSFFTDVIGRPVTVTDPVGNKWTYLWDAIDGIHQTTDPNNAHTTVNFDPDGNPHIVLDASNHQTVYAYDSRDQMLTRTDPLLAQDQFTAYDPNGNLKTVIDRNGHTATYAYDALNRISTASYADGSVVTYSWDQGNRLTQISDTAGNTVSRFYDGLDNLVCETPVSTSSCNASLAGTITYTYDAASRRKTMTVTGQKQITYSYDNADRLQQIVQNGAVVRKTYDADSRPATLTLPNGIMATYSFDAASQLGSIAYTQGSTSLGTLTYTYDSDGRVATRGGTLFQSVLPAAMAGAAFDADNRLCAWNVSGASCASPTITWDGNGNLLNDGTHNYTWDSRNRLRTLVGGGVGTTYTYDALGRRLTTTQAAVTTTSVYDFDNEVQQLQGGTPSLNLLTGLGVDESFVRSPVSAGSTVNFLTDALGSTVGLSDSTGTKVATHYIYDAFGVTSVAGTANANRQQFTGRPNDQNGLYYNRARYYNPAWGRFISEDPIGFGGGINKYAYVGNDPVNYRDPSGKQAIPLPFPPLPFPPFPIPATPPASPTPGPLPPYGTPGNPPKWCNLPSQMCALMPLDKGGRKWAQNNGYPSGAGQRAAHDAKNSDPMAQPADDYKIDPDTGEVYDPHGDPVGNAGDYINDHLE